MVFEKSFKPPIKIVLRPRMEAGNDTLKGFVHRGGHGLSMKDNSSSHIRNEPMLSH